MLYTQKQWLTTVVNSNTILSWMEAKKNSWSYVSLEIPPRASSRPILRGAIERHTRGLSSGRLSGHRSRSQLSCRHAQGQNCKYWPTGPTHHHSFIPLMRQWRVPMIATILFLLWPFFTKHCFSSFNLPAHLIVPSDNDKLQTLICMLFADPSRPCWVPASFLSTVTQRQVMWIRKNSDKFSLLTVGNNTYSGDRRINVRFQYPNNWRLHINPVQRDDAGLYTCQVSTHPPRVFSTNVTVLGKCQGCAWWHRFYYVGLLLCFVFFLLLCDYNGGGTEFMNGATRESFYLWMNLLHALYLLYTYVEGKI